MPEDSLPVRKICIVKVQNGWSPVCAFVLEIAVSYVGNQNRSHASEKLPTGGIAFRNSLMPHGLEDEIANCEVGE